MRRREHDYRVHNYIESPLPANTKGQKLVDIQSRRQMCEWSYQIIDHCGFDKETVSIAMNLLDRFLASSPWALTDMSAFQLASISALYTTIKIHEAQAIAVESMVVLSRDVYTEQQIEGMERLMLEATKWLLNPPTATAFGWRLAKIFSTMDPVRFPFDALLDRINRQLEAAVKHFLLCTMSQSLLAIGALMNALESFGMTSEIEQRQTLGNLCAALEMNDVGMEYMNIVRAHLFEYLSGTTASPMAPVVSDDEYDPDGASTATAMEEDSSLVHPTSPSSVSAVHATSSQYNKIDRHYSRQRPHPCMQ